MKCTCIRNPPKHPNHQLNLLIMLSTTLVTGLKSNASTALLNTPMSPRCAIAVPDKFQPSHIAEMMMQYRCWTEEMESIPAKQQSNLSVLAT